MLNAKALKLPLLLTQFLYIQKKLNLPGIGSFTLDPTAVIPDDHNKDPHELAAGIAFLHIPVHHADDALIDFIRTHTGKIRPLAIADLESYLNLGTELLNIGKPFHLEGIGTLTKGQDGKYAFQQGEYAISKLDELHAEPVERPARHMPLLEQENLDYGSSGKGSRNILVILTVIGALAVVGWGGYLFYKRNMVAQHKPEEIVVPGVVTAVDSSNIKSLAPADSSKSPKQGISPPLAFSESHPYKFIILRTSNKDHALRRYRQLISYDLKVNMETKDSSYFKIFFSFPALAKDTAHIKDSLKREYAHDIFIER